MATRNIVPVNDNEGNIGTSSKKWSKAWFHALHVAGNVDDGTNTVTIAQMKDLVDGHADLHEVGGSGEIDVRGLQGGWLTADVEANRPAAGTKDRYFYATDTGKLYYDNGTSWVEITPTPAEHGNEAHNPDMLPLSTSSAIDAYMSGNKWLGVATSGIVSLPKQSACRVCLSTSQSIPSGIGTLVEFDSVLYDRQNEFDTTNHRFTATEDGLYLAIAQLTWDGSTVVADRLYQLVIHVNDTKNLRVNLSPATAVHFTMTTAGVLSLTAGDYLDVHVYHTAGTDVDLLQYHQDTFFMVAKIS